MKSFFSQTFQEQLNEAVEELENQSSVELVVFIRHYSGRYSDIALWTGIILSWVALLLFFFLPMPFGNFTILTGTALAFALGALLATFVPFIRQLFVRNKRKKEQTELLARALYQKIGVHKTRQHTGVLVYVSTFEQQVVVLADTGVDSHIEENDWQVIEQEFASIFKKSSPADALIAAIDHATAFMADSLPVLIDDEEELPNTIHIDEDFTI